MNINSSLKWSRFRDGVDEHSALKAFRTAFIISSAYVLLISLYIYVSGRVAVDLSPTVEKLERVELLKGIIFALVTGILLFFSSYLTLKKISRQDNLIINQNKSIIATERLVMAGLFSSSVCHDINNMMSIIIGNSELLMESHNLDDKDKESIEQIYDASKKLIELGRRMMDAGKEYIPGKRNSENLSDTINDTIDFAKIHRKIRSCLLKCDVEPDINLNINSILVGRTLMNLILNAADATNEAGQILIRLVRDDDFVTIEVHDDGPGLTEDMKEKIFEPFYTSKIDGNGLGLLSLKICAKQHNGTIKIKKSHLGGACFCLTFPINTTKSAVQN